MTSATRLICVARVASSVAGRSPARPREVAHAAEQVDFVLREAEADLIVAGHFRAPGLRQIGRQALAVAAGIGVDRRQAISTLDAVLGTRSFDIQQRTAQAAVVAQRRIHRAAQVGIDDEGLPVQRTGTGALRVGGLPVRRDRCLRALVGRGQRTTRRGGDGGGSRARRSMK